MARLYSGKRGSSGSTRPVSRRPPSWFKYQPEEIDALVLKLSKEGNPPSIIGQILRDRYGVPLVSQIAGKRLAHLLPPDARQSIPEDLESLVKKATSAARHLEKNRKDYPNKRDRKSTRLNSSHLVISYAVFCLKKKKKKEHT